MRCTATTRGMKRVGGLPSSRWAMGLLLACGCGPSAGDDASAGRGPGDESSSAEDTDPLDDERNPTWTRYHDEDGFERAFAVAIDGQGNVLVTGTVGDDLWVRKYSPAADVLWTQTYGSGSLMIGGAVGIDSADNVIVAGHLNDTGKADLWTGKYDPDGALQWEDLYVGPGWDTATGVAIGPDDAIIVLANTDGVDLEGDTPVAERDGMLRRFDPDGHLRWEALFDSGVNDQSHGVAFVADEIVVVGETFDAGSVGGRVARFDASGVMRWEVVTEEDGVDIRGLDVTATAQGDLLVIGSRRASGENPGNDGWIRKLDGRGDEIWAMDVPAGYNLSTESRIAVAPDGDFIACGNMVADGDSAWIARYEADATQRWELRADEQIAGLAASPDGWFAVAGFTNSVKPDLWVRRLAP